MGRRVIECSPEDFYSEREMRVQLGGGRCSQSLLMDKVTSRCVGPSLVTQILRLFAFSHDQNPCLSTPIKGDDPLAAR